jgi:hypothetical protein
VIAQALAGRGVDPRPYTTIGGAPALNERSVRFRSAVDAELAGMELGRKPTTKDVQAAVDSVLKREVKIPGTWSDTTQPAALTTAKDLGRAVADLPPGQASEISRQITAAGGTLTDDRLRRAAAAYQARDLTLYNSIIRER